MLESILNQMDVKKNRQRAKQELHEAIKSFIGVRSLGDLDILHLRKMRAYMQMILCREFGIETDSPNERGINNQSMQNVLKSIT